MNLTEQEENEHCAWCGREAEDGLTIDGLSICEPCSVEILFKEGVDRRRTLSALPPKRRIEELFRAARALLKEDIGHEDVVIPTLVLAVGFDLEDIRRRLSEAKQSPARWKAEIDALVRTYSQVRALDVVEGAVIVERIRVSVEVRNYPHPHIVVPKHVEIRVGPGFRAVKPEQVALLYEDHLNAAKIAYSQQWAGSMSWHFFRGAPSLTINVEYPWAHKNAEVASSSLPARGPEFAHPYFVGRYYEMLMGHAEGPGFAKYLAGRSRGRVPVAETLVPAVTAAILRYREGIESPKEVHRLLNEHLLYDTFKTLPEGYSSSASTQLWRDVNKVRGWVLHDESTLPF